MTNACRTPFSLFSCMEPAEVPYQPATKSFSFVVVFAGAGTMRLPSWKNTIGLPQTPREGTNAGNDTNELSLRYLCVHAVGKYLIQG